MNLAIQSDKEFLSKLLAVTDYLIAIVAIRRRRKGVKLELHHCTQVKLILYTIFTRLDESMIHCSPIVPQIIVTREINISITMAMLRKISN